MSLICKEGGPTIGDDVGDVVSDRKWDIEIFGPVPKVNFGGNVLKFESPRTRVLCCLLMGPADAAAKRLLHSVHEQSCKFRLVQQLAVQF